MVIPAVQTPLQQWIAKRHVVTPTAEAWRLMPALLAATGAKRWRRLAAGRRLVWRLPCSLVSSRVCGAGLGTDAQSDDGTGASNLGYFGPARWSRSIGEFYV